jgi:hypothetical protein
MFEALWIYGRQRDRPKSWAVTLDRANRISILIIEATAFKRVNRL